MIETIEKIYNEYNKFNNYKMIKNSVTYFVPLDEANSDYQAILTWIADGGTVIDNGGSE